MLPSVLLLTTLGLVSLTIPAVFQFVIAQVLSVEMWRRGGSVVIQQVKGSIWEPITLIKSRWHYPTPRGGELRFEAAVIEVTPSWRALFQKAEPHWLDRVVVSNAIAKLELGAMTQRPERESRRKSKSFWHFPNSFEARDVDMVISAGKDYVRFNDGSFSLSNTEPGKLQLAELIVRQPWLSRTFRDVQATTALQGGKVLIADATLEKDVIVRTVETDPEKLSAGVLDTKLLIEAFGGRINAQVLTLPRDHNATLEASGNVTSINIADLAAFLSVSEPAGGTINDGHFRFRGSPRELARASASLRIDATSFQWERRQWDSLILGATLLDRKVQIPELELIQGQNRLSLHGEMELPTSDKAWWQSDFNFNVSAKIESLTELSALVLPEFRFVAGRMNIDGAVRGRNQQFNGALIASGSDITWRNAPIEELHAAVKVKGNELQVANFEILNGDDFVRGRGVVNILGAKQYWGELRASIEELGKYAALLQKPIVPEPLAGGGTITWSGEGSAKGHSGKFSARLRELRTLGATGSRIHPLRADLEGVYAPGSLHFSQFALSDEATAFIANVAVVDRTVTLQDLKLTHGDKVWLEGDAVLPLDLRRAWPETALSTLLAGDVPGKLNLTAHALQLREASRLTGWKWPIEGVVNGSLQAEGVIGQLKTSGEVTLRDARIPLNGSGELTDVSGDFVFAGQNIEIRKFACTHPTGTYQAAGSVDFTNICDTGLKLSLQSDKVSFAGIHGIGVAAGLNVMIEGPASAARITGNLTLSEVTVPGSLDTSALWRHEKTGQFPPMLGCERAPFRQWPLSLTVQGNDTPVGGSLGKLSGSLQVKGAAGAPVLSGSLSVHDGQIVSGSQTLQLREGTITFRESSPANPSIDIRVSTAAFDGEVSAVASGPLSHPIVVFDAVPPLTPELAERVIADRLGSSPQRLMAMSVPAEIGGDSPVYLWAPISTPTPEPSPDVPPAEAVAASDESAQPAAAANPIP